MADSDFQGRVQSIMQLGFAGFGMTALPLGVLAEWIGLRPTLVIMGVVAVASVAGYGVVSRAEEQPGSAQSDGLRPAPALVRR